MSKTIISKGLSVERKFTTPNNSPFDQVEWQRVDAVITDSKGNKVFEQKNVEFPKSWSMTAINIVASKYFHGRDDEQEHTEREYSLRQLIEREATTITNYGKKVGYFASDDDAATFMAELIFLELNQYGSFNSPVHFNVGVHTREPENKSDNWHWNPSKLFIENAGTGYNNPQCSACFINSVDDSMRSILNLAVTEGMLFKYGSGSGSNLSAIRGANEALSGGGQASGPLSFMRGFDAFAGVIKSGGKTRRAAKMVILNADHPDIEDFIACKGKEEAKSRVLMAAGYDGSGPDSEAQTSIFYQNANNSVRATDEFMLAAIEGKGWNLIARKNGSVTKTVNAAELLRKIAEETWNCGDPGMQFDTTINKWHTCKTTGRINASNPCSEYMFLDDTSCNLASVNLVKFLREDGTFDIQAFKVAVRIFIIAQDILVDLAGYPTEKIARNSHDFRPLGLGYANLGTLLMSMGLAYDSEDGRNMAAAVTALMGGMAYRTSTELAATLAPLAPAGEFGKKTTNGAFPGFAENEDSFREVMNLHRLAAEELYDSYQTDMSLEALRVWRDVDDIIYSWAGFRNSQVTVLAPTGTIGFMMDCDTTGIEPDLALVKFKKLVGGGMLKIVNTSVPSALQKLGYNDDQVNVIVSYIDKTGTIEGAPGLREKHLSIFDCAFRPANGKRSISWQGHVDMMAAAQPFLSGAISKTVNLPAEATVVDIAAAYTDAWRNGLKAVAIYRDGSKGGQPMSVKKDDEKNDMAAPTVAALPPVNQPDLNAAPVAVRHRLPNERASVTHKFKIANYEGYLHVGLYANGQPGELFIRMAKEGSMVSGLMDTWAQAISMALQHGAPLKTLTSKMVNASFEPSGWTGSEEFGFAKSIPDYIGRWLQARFGEGRQLDLFNNHAPLANGAIASAVVPMYIPPVPVEEEQSLTDLVNAKHGAPDLSFADAPACSSCGGQMRPTGKCWSCQSCGTSNGGCS